MRFRKGSLTLSALTIVGAVACGLVISVASNEARAEEEAKSSAPGGSGYTLHLAKMTQLKKESDDLEEEIKKLVAEKREADDDAQVRQMTNEIAEKYKALKTAGDKLEEEANLVRFRYPEESGDLDRKYVRFKTKSLKDIEGEVGIDGKLDHIRNHVLAIYPVPELEAKKNAPPKVNPIFVRKPASEDANQDVPEKIILSK